MCIRDSLYTKRIVPKQVLLIVFGVIIIGESAAAGYIGVKTTTVTGTYDYPRGEESTAQVIDYMDSLESNTTEMWRAEMTSTQTLNDAALNHYNGLSMFNSMANVDMTVLFENFGMMGWKSGNRYTYAEGSPVTNLFMNLKYLIARDNIYMNTYDLTEVYGVGNVKLLQNNHYLPMGFMTNSALASWQVDENEDQFNPFDKQNEFFKLATGIKDDVYTPLDVVSQGHTDYNQFPVNKTGYGRYSFSCTDTTVTPHVKWNYEAPKDGLYLMYADISGGDDVTVMINDVAQSKTYGMGRSYIACIGQCKKGDKISVYSNLQQGQSGSAMVFVDVLNQDVFEEGYNKLSKSVMTTTKLTGSSMEGTINAQENGLFYTSVPYEEGWKAYVDGKEVTITPVGNALVAFNLDKGEHTIKLEYYPKGFAIGLTVTIICAATFAFLCVWTYIIKKRRKKKGDISENPEEVQINAE